MVRRIAVYGKGGIGKTTVSSNLSRSLAHMGYSVMQIGCDPKHDSVRLLTDGAMETMMDYCRRVPPSRRQREDIVRTGREGVLCVEAGGPEPGFGCAGKGIITTFHVLESLGADGSDRDFVIYDVLGDVVCGGFAMPMREAYSDSIILVTSGEPMSLYAANNILRGTLGFGTERVLGIVLNRRGIEGEEEMVKRFSDSVGIPIIADIPRSDNLLEADRQRRTVLDHYPNSEESSAFLQLASIVSSNQEMHSAKPLTDDQFDRLLLTGSAGGPGEYVRPEPIKATGSTPWGIRRIGMGPTAAVREASKVVDVPIVIHGPASCIHAMGDVAFDELVRDSSSIPCIVTGSRMDRCDCIYGGLDSLRNTLESLRSEGHDRVSIVTTCVSGIIGDDLQSFMTEWNRDHPDCIATVIDAGRAESGGDAHMDVLEAMASLIIPTESKDENTAVIVDDNFIELNRGSNGSYAESLFKSMGMKVLPGFLDRCSVTDIESLGRVSLAVFGEKTDCNLHLRSILESKGIRFMDSPLPRGYHQTVDWMKELGEITGKQSLSNEIIRNMTSEYNEAIESARATLKGRTITIVSRMPCDCEWIADTLRDAGASVQISETDNECDLRIGGNRSDSNIRFMPLPESTVSNRASIDLLRRASNVISADMSLGWKNWGGSR